VVIAALGSAQAMSDENGSGKPCNDRTLRGDYGIQMQGTRPTPPPNVVTESVVGVVLRTFDGYGSFAQVDNIKGSVTGIVPDRPGEGTYEVNSDCTGRAFFQPDPNNPNLVIEETFVIVDNGNEIRSIVLSPPSLMVSSVAKRVRQR
jgi:hypothetical protein